VAALRPLDRTARSLHARCVQRYFKAVLCACAVALVAVACTPKQPAAIRGVGELGDRDGGRPRSDAGLALDPEPLGYGVVASDYTVSSISLLDADGLLLQRDFVNSGSAPAGLVTALSGDVVLPTRSGDPGVLTLIDRFRSDVITRIDIARGVVLGQLKMQAPNTGDDARSYSSNPQDYVQLDQHTAWVSRFEPKLGATRADPDRGLDLLRIDPSELTRSAERIDFSGLNGVAKRTNPDTGEQQEVEVYARPSRIVRLWSHYLAVGVASFSSTFDAAGDGMVALVDLDDRSVQALPLPGLQSCASVVPVPDDDTRVAVACTGFYRALARDSAGLATLVLREGKLEVERIWRAKEHPDAAATAYGLVALSAREVVAMAAGQAEVTDRDGDITQSATNDKLYRIDLESGEQTEVFEAEGRYVIGDGSYNPRAALLLVPDASVDGRARPTAGVRRFVRKDDGTLDPLE